LNFAKIAIGANSLTWTGQENGFGQKTDPVHGGWACLCCNADEPSCLAWIYDVSFL